MAEKNYYKQGTGGLVAEKSDGRWFKSHYHEVATVGHLIMVRVIHFRIVFLLKMSFFYSKTVNVHKDIKS